MAIDDSPLAHDGDRAARIAKVIEDAVAARVRGAPRSDQSLIDAHPELLPELAEELQELAAILRARSRADRTNENSCATQLQSLSATLPGYEITREIRGGVQGVVYEAIQESTGRKVAIKIMKQGPFAGSAERTRFDREVGILGQIQHPNIVGIHATGIAAGRHYYVMDFISGLVLGGYMAASERSIDETLRLFAKICQAISAAHLRGIIHRDLKPTNIVVDPDGQPHVLDFGLAKFSRSEANVDMSVTQSGHFIGTPAYAAPEQVRLEHDLVDGRTDLYSLGMILFQMLTGGMPYPISSDIRKLADTIEHTPPQRPSRLNPRIGRELDFILLKALSKEKSNRYQTATAFAADIRRHLAGQSVLAHPPSALYQVRKLIRRHRWPFAFGVTVLVLLVAFGVVSGIMAFRIADQRDQAQANLIEAEAQRGIARKETAEAQRQRDHAKEMTIAADWQAYVGNLAAADAALRVADTTAARAAQRRLDTYLPSLTWEWMYLTRRMERMESAGAPRAINTIQLPEPVLCIEFSPDGRRIAAGRQGGIVSIHDVTAATPPLELPANTGPVNMLAFAPDGRTIATAASDGAIRFWNASDGSLLGATARQTAAATAIAWGPRGEHIAAGYADGRVIVWPANGDYPVASLDGHTSAVSKLRWAAASDFLVSAGLDATMRVWNPREAEQTGVIPLGDRSVHALTISPDDELLVCGLSDGRIVIADRRNLESTTRLEGHMERVTGLAFSPDGTRLISVSTDGTLRLWDVARHEEILTLHGHEAPITSVSFSPDGTRIATAATDGTVRILEAEDSAAEHVQLLATELTPAEIIETLEADDALDASFRRVALLIARDPSGPSPASQPADPQSGHNHDR